MDARAAAAAAATAGIARPEVLGIERGGQIAPPLPQEKTVGCNDDGKKKHGKMSCPVMIGCAARGVNPSFTLRPSQQH